MAVTTDQLSIDPEELIRDYEGARRAAGIGHREWRLTPGQHLDLHRLVAAMRAQGGVAAGGASVDVWVNYLAPIIAESGPARRLLQDVLQSQLAQPNSEISGGGTGSTSEGAGLLAKTRQMMRGRSNAAWLALFLAAAVLISAAIALYPHIFLRTPSRIVTTVPPSRGNVPTPPTPAPPAQEAAAAAFNQAWNVTLAVVRDRDFMAQGLTPRRFAAVHAGLDPRLGTPDVLLANLLRTWPWPPDKSLVLSTSNDPSQQNPIRPRIDGPAFAALRRLTAEVAVLRSGLPRVLFEDLRPELLTSTDVAETAAGAVASVRPNRWSNAWLLLSGVPLLIYCLFAAATHRKKVQLLVDRWLVSERRSMRWPRALEGIKQTSAPLMEASLPPFVDRRSLRGLIRYEPAPGRRLDAPRSIAALIRQEGMAAPVMRPVRRAVSYVVIVQRRQPHDHERLRVRQLFAYLADRGLPFFAYDYDFDPLTVKRAAAAAGDQRSDGVNGREELVHLSALRDLHPKSRMVLVTDGRDLVDRFSGRVRADIARAFAFWRDRMVLTPVPIGDWGEVELALSRDIGAPLGRTGEEAVADLEQGFRAATDTPPYRLALLQSRSVPNASGRLDAWWQAVSERFGSSAFLSRGDALSFDQRMLTTDIPPPNETIEAMVDDLYRWLGDRGFYWHAACAIYPQLRFDLTVHIGRVLQAGPQHDAPVLLQDTAEDRRAFERMTALPWFRSGRMPEWLRRRVLAALSREDLDRATAVIADLFRNAPAREGPLAVWWPRTGALAIPPDAVMSEAFQGDIKHEAEPIIVSEARKAELLRAARRMQLKRELTTGTFFLLACIGLWLLMPDLTQAPHVRGAWFPALGFAVSCVAVLTTFVLVRRVFRTEPPLPQPRPVSLPPSGSPTVEQHSNDSESQRTTGGTTNAAPG